MKKLFPVLAASVAALSAASATGIRITDHDAKATARGDAFVATADTPAAIYYNPAGITQLDGFNVRMGGYMVDIDAEFFAPNGDNFRNTNDWQALPSFFATYKKADSKFAFGLGYYLPYGLAMSWKDDAPFATIGQGARVQYHSLNPVIAWEPIKNLSIAAGLTINHAESAQRVATPGVNGEFKIEGSGEDVGFNLGLLWQPTPQHSFGIQYRSKTAVRLSGHTYLSTEAGSVATPFGDFQFPSSSVERDADATFHFPQYVTFGYSFRPTPDWNFEVDVDWTDWNDLRTLYVHQQGAPEVGIPFEWDDGFSFAFGATRELPKGFHVSTGYFYGQRSVPEATFNAIVPDNRRHVFSVGVGQKIGRFSWDVAYQHTYQPSRNISNGADPITGASVDGDYRLRANAVAVSVGYAF